MNAYPGWRLSLFRRDVGRYQDLEVDARVTVPGKVLQLKGHFLHYGFESIAQRLKPMDRYTRYEADERMKQGRRFSWLAFLGRPVAVFVYNFIWKQGFRDGFRGFILSIIRAEFVFWTYAKIWEKKWQAGRR